MRLLALGLGAGVLLWLPVEDQGIHKALFFAAGSCAWAATWMLVSVSPRERGFFWRHLLTASLAGLLVSPLTVGLMLIKSGSHAHSTPDFSLAQMQAVFLRTPFWMGGGFLLGLGAATWRMAGYNSAADKDR